MEGFKQRSSHELEYRLPVLRARASAIIVDDSLTETLKVVERLVTHWLGTYDDTWQAESGCY
jgi:hypothetical protein